MESGDGWGKDWALARSVPLAGAIWPDARQLIFAIMSDGQQFVTDVHGIDELAAAFIVAAENKTDE